WAVTAADQRLVLMSASAKQYVAPGYAAAWHAAVGTGLIALWRWNAMGRSGADAGGNRRATPAPCAAEARSPAAPSAPDAVRPPPRGATDLPAPSAPGGPASARG